MVKRIAYHAATAAVVLVWLAFVAAIVAAYGSHAATIPGAATSAAPDAIGSLVASFLGK